MFVLRLRYALCALRTFGSYPLRLTPYAERLFVLGLADFVLGFLVGKQFILMRDLLLIGGLFRLSLFPPFPALELGIIPVVIQIFPNLGDIGLQGCYIGL